MRIGTAAALAAAMWLGAAAPAAARVCAPHSFVIALDVGHTAAVGGATSARGISEFEFNARFAREALTALREAGFERAFLVDDTGGPIELLERTRRAQLAAADFFVSIHHDSVQPRFLTEWVFEGETRRTTNYARGFSIFITETPAGGPHHAAASRRFAERLADGLIARGLTPTLHHAEPIKGENRKLLDRDRGVYAFPELAVLRTAAMPAALYEVGVIINKDEEAILATPEGRTPHIAALVEALWAACASERP